MLAPPPAPLPRRKLPIGIQNLREIRQEGHPNRLREKDRTRD